MSDITVRIALKDFRVPPGQPTGLLPPDRIQGGQPLVTQGTCKYVEWTVSLPSAGRWHLRVRHSTPGPAPCYLSINGVQQSGVILSETTRGAALPQWFSYGPYDFKQGENVLRIVPLRGQHSLIWDLGFADEVKVAPPPPPPPPPPPDDLEAIEGIGQKIAEFLKNAGIRTYKDLAAANVPDLKKLLGKKYARNDPSSWPKQAQLLLEGKKAELKELQDSLRAGRAPKP
jgi:hypothetical protein